MTAPERWRRWRRDWLTRPLFDRARSALPRLSQTEREALEAGDVWWDAALFSGDPDWNTLLALPPPLLRPDEQAFLEGPCRTLCGMVDDWRINHEDGDLPEPVWRFMKENRFFGMIIPQRYGGLGFSAHAHSEVVRLISTRSLAAAVTVMVPNSLGPGELLLQFGTDAQRDHWLPRLADGREIPAFALTSAQAGSDAAAMTDRGVVCRGRWNGVETLGIRLDWNKRYITLAPVATLLGLAVKLYDPEHLLGEAREPGITSLLVPTDLPGVTIGRRHLPAGQRFQNGPTRGDGVFVPLDHIIGGPEYAGRGWMMLMSALAAGRGISLPSLSAAASTLAAHTTGAYARVREQFGVPIGRFEGVQEPLGRLAANAYLLDAARRLTCVGLDAGHRLAVISAIMKAQATERMRLAVDAAMDVHAGKAVIDGPRNYLGNVYRAVPVAITVEGSNLLTRNLIVFGQGAIRCHPHLLAEMLALQQADGAAAREAFDRALWPHLAHVCRTVLRAAGRAWFGSRAAAVPGSAAVGRAAPSFRQLSRWSAAFALTAEAALLTLGGALKRRELLSARLGDVLSELYLLSATLKRWVDEGRHDADWVLVEHAMADGCARIGRALDAVLANLPNRPVAWVVRALTRPGAAPRGPADATTRACAELLLTPSTARNRLTHGLYHGHPEDPLARLATAFTKVIAVEPLRQRLHAAGGDPERALQEATLTAAELARLRDAEEAVAAVIAVDDFGAGEVAGDVVDRDGQRARSVGRPMPVVSKPPSTAKV